MLCREEYYIIYQIAELKLYLQDRPENTQSNSEKLLCPSLDRNVGDHHSYDKSKNCEVHDALFDQKLELATEGLEPYYLDHLRTRLSKENALTIY
jgi:hypothetical protein